jgi:hypothetical protein
MIRKFIKQTLGVLQGLQIPRWKCELRSDSPLGQNLHRKLLSNAMRKGTSNHLVLNQGKPNQELA